MPSLCLRDWIVRYLVFFSLGAAVFLQGGRGGFVFAEEGEQTAPVAPQGAQVAEAPQTPLASTTSTPVAASAGTTGGEYIIGPADGLEVILWKEEDLSRKVQVRVDGWISVPLIGDVEAAGKTISGLATMLSELYGKVLEDPSVTVILLEGRSYRYYLIGKVKTPGEFRIDAPLTILQAIARSGGFAEWAKTDDVLLVRKGQGKQEIFHFDYDAFVKGKNVDKNYEIMPGDIIVVP